MARANWHNLNANRSYPLVDWATARTYKSPLSAPTALPPSAIVDFGATLRHMADPGKGLAFSGEQAAVVYLDSVVSHRNGQDTFLKLVFKYAEQPAMRFAFTVYPADPFGTTRYVDASFEPDDPDAIALEWGTAFLTVGDVAALWAAFPPPAETPAYLVYAMQGTPEAHRVEPSLVACHFRHAIRRVFVGNDPMTPPARCSANAVAGKTLGEEIAADMEGVSRENPDGTLTAAAGAETCPARHRTIVVTPAPDVPAGGIVGTLKFKPGYNAGVRVLPEDGVVEIGAQVGDGEGEICGTEEDGDPWTREGGLEALKNGAPIDKDREWLNVCADLLYTINGIPPNSAGDFRINSGAGISVTPDPIGDESDLDEVREITVAPRVVNRAETCVSLNLAMEAEDYSSSDGLLGSKATVVDEAKASEGRAVRLQSDAGLKVGTAFHLGGAPAGRIAHDVLVPAAGKYVVWARVRAGQAAANRVLGMRLSIPESEESEAAVYVLARYFTPPGGDTENYFWIRMYEYAGGPDDTATISGREAPWEIWLPPGTSRLYTSNVLGSDGDSLYVDQILVTSNTGYRPTCAE